MIATDTMQNVRKSFDEKQAAFLDMQKAMTDAMNRNVNNQINLKTLDVSKGYKSDYCDIQLGDCVQLIRNVPDESIGFSIFSPPFAELYTYSDKLEDMGNSKDYKEFFHCVQVLGERIVSRHVEWQECGRSLYGFADTERQRGPYWIT